MWRIGEWETWWLRTRDASSQLFVTESGVGDVPVVVLHGGPGGDSMGVFGLVDGIERERRVVLFDQRGSFRSRAPLESLSFDALLDDLDHLIDALEVERVDLVGHSMGAVLAAAYVNGAGDARVRRLVLVGPGPLRQGHDDDAELLAAQFAERMHRETDPAWGSVAQRFGLPPEPSTLGPRESARWARLRDAWLFTTTPERADQMASGTFFSRDAGLAIDATVPSTFDQVTALQDRAGPVTVIVGDADLVDVGARLSRHWFPEDGHVRCVVLEGVGHSPWIDGPEETRQALLDALG